MKRILCYGDSNTYGYDARMIPIDGTHSRYDENTRWPCILHKLLGPDWTLWEAGLNGRTTVFEDPLESGRCGIKTLDVTFRCCDPVDLVLIMLGTNDLKDQFSVSASVISSGMERLVTRLKELISVSLNPEAKILIVAPTCVSASSTGEFYYDFSSRSIEVGNQLSEQYRLLAQRTGCFFADASSWIHTDPSDGVHLTPEAHRILSEKLYDLIQSIF